MDEQQVSEHLEFECVLCGRRLGLQEFEQHARLHALSDECWTYATFAGACKLDRALEGWPVTLADGRERVWPHWQHLRVFESLIRPLRLLRA